MGNESPLPTKSATGDRNHVSPVVTIVDSPGFAITDIGLVRPYSSSSYVYGVMLVDYSGSEELLFVRADLKYRDAKRDVLFTGRTYFDNDSGFCAYGTGGTATCVAPKIPSGALTFIEDLSAYGVDLSQINEVDVRFTHENMNVQAVVEDPLTSGPIREGASDTWLVATTNTFLAPLEVKYPTLALHDENGRIGYWTFGDVLLADGTVADRDTQAIIAAGQTATVQFVERTPDYLAAALTPERVLLGGQPVAASTARGVPRTGSRDERNAWMLMAINESIDQLRLSFSLSNDTASTER